jgi:hypothetical protein
MCNNSCKKNVSCTVAGCFSCRHSCCCHSCCCSSHCFHDMTVGCNISYLCNNQGVTATLTTTGTTATWVNPYKTYRCCRCGYSYTSYIGNATITYWGGQTITGGAIANGGLNQTVSIPTVWTSGNIYTNVNSSLGQKNSGGAQSGNSQKKSEDHTGCDCDDCR